LPTTPRSQWRGPGEPQARPEFLSPMHGGVGCSKLATLLLELVQQCRKPPGRFKMPCGHGAAGCLDDVGDPVSDELAVPIHWCMISRIRSGA
jgi:hypothetical protein